jgi:molybdopterin synthase sulfur carrier subunit
MVKVNFFATLRPIVGGKTVETEFSDGMTLRQLLRQLVERFPQLRAQVFDENENLFNHIHVFVNGRDSLFLPDKLETIIRAEDVVNIFPPVGGG